MRSGHSEVTPSDSPTNEQNELTQYTPQSPSRPGGSGREREALPTDSHPGLNAFSVEIVGLKLPSLSNAREAWFLRRARAKKHRALANVGLRKALLERARGATRRHVTRFHVPSKFGEKAAAEEAERLRRLLAAAGAKVVFPLQVTICRNAARALDSDNLAGAAKHLRDGIADFLGVDDRTDLIQWVYKPVKTERGQSSVTITISPLTKTFRGAAAVVMRRKR